MMSNRRPSNLAYRAKDGLYSTYLPLGANYEDLYDFIAHALDWSATGGGVRYRILDTFFSDSISPPLLARAISTLHDRGGSLRVLLAAPDSHFARARGAAIGQSPERESVEGLRQLQSAMVACGIGRKSPHDRSLESLVADISAAGESVGLQVGFYDAAPTAPLYFFDDILVMGRFSYDESSVANPWWMIVDDPSIDNDLFNSFDREFRALWERASPTPLVGSPLRLDIDRSRVPAIVLAIEIASSGEAYGLERQAELSSALFALIDGHSSVRSNWPGQVICLPAPEGATVAFIDGASPLFAIELAEALILAVGAGALPLLRVGIDMGPVLIGRNANESQTCLGGTVTRASEIMRSSDPGQARISDAYYGACLADQPDWVGRVSPSTSISTRGTDLRIRVLSPH